jgi:hypothetical protein
MHLHGLACLGAHWPDSSHVENFKFMQRALKRLAADSQHPELVNAPYAATGFSAGGGFASTLLVGVPDKVIASVIVGSRLNLTGIKPTPAHLGTPAWSSCGMTFFVSQRLFEVPIPLEGGFALLDEDQKTADNDLACRTWLLGHEGAEWLDPHQRGLG